jgi:hypothetical protein
MDISGGYNKYNCGDVVTFTYLLVTDDDCDTAAFLQSEYRAVFLSPLFKFAMCTDR